MTCATGQKAAPSDAQTNSMRVATDATRVGAPKENQASTQNLHFPVSPESCRAINAYVVSSPQPALHCPAPEVQPWWMTLLPSGVSALMVVIGWYVVNKAQANRERRKQIRLI